MFTGTCFRHAENTIYFFSAYRNTSSCMAYAITKAGVRWFLDSYPMPMPLNLMALSNTSLYDASLFLFFLSSDLLVLQAHMTLPFRNVCPIILMHRKLHFLQQFSRMSGTIHDRFRRSRCILFLRSAGLPLNLFRQHTDLE